MINKLIAIKKQYNSLKVPKTKKAREKFWDKQRALRYEFIDIADQLDIAKYGKHLNLMCPGGGPWCLLDAENFKDEGNYLSFNYKGDTARFVGLYDLLDDSCGIDNLAIIAEIENNA